MKISNIFHFLILLMLTSIFVGCEKEQQVSDETIIKDDIAAYHFYLDGKEVREIDFNDESLHISLLAEESANPEFGIINVWAFTSKEKHITWGEFLGLSVALTYEVEEHLRDYAEKNGVIESYENTGTVSDSYTQYEKEYYSKVTNEKANSRASAMIFKDIRDGSSAPMALTLPFMWPGWNNRVSRYFGFYVHGAMVMYDRSFYRSRMITLWGWGWQTVTLQGPLAPLNDRMSSGIIL